MCYELAFPIKQVLEIVDNEARIIRNKTDLFDELEVMDFLQNSPSYKGIFITSQVVVHQLSNTFQQQRDALKINVNQWIGGSRYSLLC